MFIASLALVSSCAKENPFQEGDSRYPLTEFTATSSDTKTAIEEGHTVWTVDDKIKVFWSGQNAVASLKTGEGTSHATFEAKVPEATEYYAVYPASIGSAVGKNGYVAVTIPGRQDGKFAAGHIAVAKAKDKSFAFRNINAFLKIILPSTGYTKITVESVGGQPLVGMLSMTVTEEGVTIGEAMDAESLVILATDAALSQGEYYLSILPGITHDKGLLVKYYVGEDVRSTYYLDKVITTEASRILSFGEFEPSKEYFASVEGSGSKSGTSSDNAMDISALKKFLTINDQMSVDTKLDIIDGVTVNLLAGTYDFAELFELGFGGREVSLTFKGASSESGQTVITGSDKHRLLTVKSGVKVVLEGITFANSRSATSSEPALYFEEGSDVTLLNCNISDNVNIKSDGSKYNTGAGVIAETGASVLVDGCEFARNQASWGAALILKGDAVVKNSFFKNNTGNNGPGNSIYLDADAQLLIENCTFKENTSNETHGGAFSASNGSITFRNCTFEDNVQSNKNGAAIRLWNTAHAVLDGCTMKGNHANYGGAIYLENTSEIDIVGGTYDGNYAKGGGLVNASASSVVKISGKAVIRNNYSTTGHGGALLMDAGLLECKNVTFEKNSNRDSSSKTFGGAVGSTGAATLNISDCTFKENYSECFGGPAVNIQADAVLTLKNCVFEGNYNNAKGIPSSNNNGNYAGGAVRLNSTAEGIIEDCIFRNNSVAQSSNYDHSYGGAVYINSKGTYKFNRCLFENNSSTRGGALCAWATDAKIYMNACSFTGNWISYRYGTTIHIEKAGEFCMNNCSIADNTYSTGGTDNWQSCWLNLSTITSGLCISNCSFIGSPRVGAEAAVNSGKSSALVRFDSLESDNNYFVNDIIVTNETAGVNKALANYNKAITLVYTKRSDNSANGAGGSANAVESPASNGFANTSDYFGGLQWMSGSSYASNYWNWTGALSGGANLSMCPAATAVEYIGKISGFKSWLESIGALDKDQLGTDRGTAEWWPGAYQKNIQ